jgi:hypothetical protein
MAVVDEDVPPLNAELPPGMAPEVAAAVILAHAEKMLRARGVVDDAKIRALLGSLEGRLLARIRAQRARGASASAATTTAASQPGCGGARAARVGDESPSSSAMTTGVCAAVPAAAQPARAAADEAAAAEQLLMLADSPEGPAAAAAEEEEAAEALLRSHHLRQQQQQQLELQQQQLPDGLQQLLPQIPAPVPLQKQASTASVAAASGAAPQVFKRRLYMRPNLLTHRKSGFPSSQLSLDSNRSPVPPSSSSQDLAAAAAAPAAVPPAPAPAPLLPSALLSGQLPAAVAAAADLPSASMQPLSLPAGPIPVPVQIPVRLPRAAGDAGSGNSTSTLAPPLPLAATPPAPAPLAPPPALPAPLVRACQARLALQSMLDNDSAFSADRGAGFLPPAVAASVGNAIRLLDSHLIQLVAGGGFPGPL